ncbi:MAG: hypothetical protein WAT39_22310 [Planctomycetota bacterium]
MGIPHPEDELDRLRTLTARGLPTVTILTGSADHFRVEAVEALLAAMPKSADLRILDAVDVHGAGGKDDGADDEDGDVVDVAADAEQGLEGCPELQELRGGGLFAKTSFLVVRRGGGWWKQQVEMLALAIPTFGKGCGLVIEAAKLDKRKKAAQALVKELAARGALFEFRDLWDSPFDRNRSPLEGELCKWVVARAKQLGVALRPDAAWLVVLQAGKAPAALLAELGRVRDRFGADKSRKPLAPEDLRGKLNWTSETTQFEFTEAAMAGDRRGALRSLRAMFDRGMRGKDGKRVDHGGLLPATTSWLFQQLAVTWEGRQLLDAGTSPRDLPAKAGVHVFAERFLAQVQANDLPRLRRGLQALHACQRASRLTAEEPDVLLERMLAQWFDGAPIPSLQDLEA